MPRRNPRKSREARLLTASDNSLPRQFPSLAFTYPDATQGVTGPVQAKSLSSTGAPGTSTPHGLALRGDLDTQFGGRLSTLSRHSAPLMGGDSPCPDLPEVDPDRP